MKLAARPVQQAGTVILHQKLFGVYKDQTCQQMCDWGSVREEWCWKRWTGLCKKPKVKPQHLPITWQHVKCLLKATLLGSLVSCSDSLKHLTLFLKLETKRGWPRVESACLPGHGKGECTQKCFFSAHQKPWKQLLFSALPGAGWNGGLRQRRPSRKERESINESEGEKGWVKHNSMSSSWCWVALKKYQPQTLLSSKRNVLVVPLLFPRTGMPLSRNSQAELGPTSP